MKILLSGEMSFPIPEKSTRPLPTKKPFRRMKMVKKWFTAWPHVWWTNPYDR